MDCDSSGSLFFYKARVMTTDRDIELWADFLKAQKKMSKDKDNKAEALTTPSQNEFLGKLEIKAKDNVPLMFRGSISVNDLTTDKSEADSDALEEWASGIVGGSEAKKVPHSDVGQHVDVGNKVYMESTDERGMVVAYKPSGDNVEVELYALSLDTQDWEKTGLTAVYHLAEVEPVQVWPSFEDVTQAAVEKLVASYKPRERK